MGSIEKLRAAEITDHGGHFYRTDFQVHTPRDTQWDGKRPQNEEERKTWASQFVSAAREKNLQAVAISDHHDFTLFPYVKDAAKHEKNPEGKLIPDNQQLVVFPAIEATLSVPCQVIIVLDADFPENRLDDVLKLLHFQPIDPNLDQIPQTTVLPDSGDINEIHARFDKEVWLKGRYIILPNVTPSGHKTLLRTEFQEKYKEMICVGGYLDGSIAQLEGQKKIGKKRILQGGDIAWGSKRLAVFQTSDSRTHDFSTLGSSSTWIKWAQPTAEAIRQACLAQDSRISQSEPALPNVWISRLTVSNSKFMGRIDVSLNPQFTSLIGGRGTGKSTILDYLRWVLCDQPSKASETDEIADQEILQRNLIETTLKPYDAVVEVHLRINGIPHVLRKSSKDGSLSLKVGNLDFVATNENNIRSLFPIQAYSQKQLSSVAIRRDELRRFITAPIFRELEEISRKEDEVIGRLRENYGTLQRYRNLSQELKKSKMHVDSLNEQSQSLRESIPGLSDEDRSILDGKQAHDEVKSTAENWDIQLNNIQNGIGDLLSLFDSASTNLTEPSNLPDDLKDSFRSYRIAMHDLLSKLQTQLSLIKAGFATSLREDGQLGTRLSKLQQALHTFDSSYASVKGRSSAQQTKLEELAALEEQQRQAQQLMQSQQTQRDILGDPLVQHKQLREELLTVRNTRTMALQQQCDAISKSSDGLIRATLSLNNGFDIAADKLKGMITGSNVRLSRIDDFFENISKEQNPSNTWEKSLKEFESLSLLEPDVDITTESTPILSRLGLRPGDQKKIASKLTPDNWLDLSLVDLTSTPKFEYQSKEGEYIPFAAASAGQQASALLAMLLTTGSSPLLIDQPEDDLDSDTIQRIVGKIWHAKTLRQLIFASHNANLVVNGDADLVLVCAYLTSGDQSAGQIKEQGAIDIPDVRKEITAVMEGGEKAFLLRKEKYGF